MKILSISSGHDFNVSFFDSSKDDFRYIKFEREFSNKHLSFFCGLTLINSVIDILKMYWGYDHYDLIVLNNCPSFKLEEFLNENNKEEKIKCNICERSHNTINIEKIISINHHYSHVLSGFPLLKNFHVDYGVCFDGIGDHHETISFFKNPFSENYKRIKWIRNSISTNLYGKKCIDKNTSYGLSFEHVGSLLGLKGQTLDFSGKIMGLQSYGKPIQSDLNSIDLDKIKYNFCSFTKDYFKNIDASFNNDFFLNKLSTWHKICEKSVMSIFEDIIEDKNSTIVYSGGFAQNTVINESIKQKYKNTIIVPHCYDGGRSLGGIFYACRTYKLKIPYLKEYPYIQNDEIFDKPSIDLVKKVANMLADGKIVGWHQGKGEIGPRALGNRSILMNPTIINGKNILNSKVKHRESWRPYAASVLAEFANEWFHVEEDSPFMMRAVKVKEEKVNKVPAVVHNDGTCRIQTVSKLNNELFYDLINQFYKITSVPLLLNTSLNKGGKPIAGNASDSLELFNNSEMDAIVIGKILCIKS